MVCGFSVLIRFTAAFVQDMEVREALNTSHKIPYRQKRRGL